LGEHGAGRRRSSWCAGGVIVNDAGLFAAIAGLPSLSHDDRNGGCKVCIEPIICTAAGGFGIGALRLVIKLVVALAEWTESLDCIE
jgi:hypothetical protein